VNTQKNDIALRLVEVLSRSGEPNPNNSPFRATDGEVVGKVPIHLRHLNNFMDEIRAKIAERCGLASKPLENHQMDEVAHLTEILDAVKKIFFGAVCEHMNLSGWDSVMITDDWSVIVHRNDGQRMSPLAAIFAQVLNDARRQG
jgi:hypothetical protein